MVRLVETIGSNTTGLYKAREINPGEIPPNAAWFEKEPNEYGDFGTELNTVARQPINSDRQQKKGTVVGFSASGGYTTDVTATNIVEDVEEFFFAAARYKTKLITTSVLADGYAVAAGGAAYVVGTLLFAKGNDTPANNGLRLVTVAGAAAKVSAPNTVVEAGPGIITRVGHQFAAGDAVIDASGPLPKLMAGDIDFLTLGIIPGEIIYIGGDGPAFNFTEGANKGFARVLAVEETGLTLDKTDAVFLDDLGAGKTVQIFFGTVIKNEKAELQRTFTSSLRRLLGRPDLDAPGVVQSEVLTRCVANEMNIEIPEEDKLTAELNYIAGDYLTFKDDATEVGGTFIGVEENDAVNSTSDAARASMVVYPEDGANSAPLPLFAVFSELSLSVNNNVGENKAITRLGSFALTPGIFEVSASFTAYFVTVDALRAVRDNASVSFLFVASKDRKGFAFDLPMLTLSTSGLSVELNEPIMCELDGQGATGKRYNPAMDHTALAVFYDYLPRQSNN